MASVTKRLTNELSDINNNRPREIVYMQPNEDNLMHWRAIIQGPLDSPYEDGMFELGINIPMEYPMKPPSVVFVTPVCHPNVHFETGEICLDILRAEWSPVWTLKTVSERKFRQELNSDM
ncbi:hypothetical protein BB559_003088 [Furculomyces boomerangus]|uniref:UBC core domain-containing protein n=1 Tax=Furculomyces boomerangus TaxID=61424 RepID=A0A2T9YP60_9FUNG|nr:hypothetical protein BB559_003088 [Furculomyces boomerangus]